MNARIIGFGLCLAGCGTGVSPAGPADNGPRLVLLGRSVSDLVIGDRFQMLATVVNSGNDTLANAAVVWTSDRPDVLDISSSGLLHAIAIGTAVISARSASDSSIRTFNVLAAQPDKLVIEAFSPTMPVGQSVRLDAAVTARDSRPLPNASVAWSSDKNAVATVDPDGSMHAVSVGEAYITATSGRARDTRFVIVVPAGPAQIVDAAHPSIGGSIRR